MFVSYVSLAGWGIGVIDILTKLYEGYQKRKPLYREESTGASKELHQQLQCLPAKERQKGHQLAVSICKTTGWQEKMGNLY